MSENAASSIYLTQVRMYTRSIAVLSAIGVTLLAAYHILLVPIVLGPEYAPWRAFTEVYFSFHAETETLLTAEQAVSYYAEKEFGAGGVSTTPTAADLAAINAELVHVTDLLAMVIGMGLAAYLTR